MVLVAETRTAGGHARRGGWQERGAKRGGGGPETVLMCVPVPVTREEKRCNQVEGAAGDGNL